jgi:hypothetical protein
LRLVADRAAVLFLVLVGITSSLFLRYRVTNKEAKRVPGVGVWIEELRAPTEKL